MKAIVTKYIGPTDYKGARIAVKAEGLPTMYVHWDDGLHVDANHTKAAQTFAQKYLWLGQWTGGGMPDGTGNCYVRIPRWKIEPEAYVADDNSFYVVPPARNSDD